jgi:hypothetical protein
MWRREDLGVCDVSEFGEISIGGGERVFREAGGVHHSVARTS